jgi:hypothetical protein
MVQQKVQKAAKINMIAYILATQPQDLQRFRENVDTMEAAWRDMGESIRIHMSYLLTFDRDWWVRGIR